MTSKLGLSMGAILIASWFATGLSGIIQLQAYTYYRSHSSSDSRIIKGLIALLLSLDIAHVVCIMVTLYAYLIRNFGDNIVMEYFPATLALTVGLTGTITFFAQSFYTWKIWTFTRGNFIAVPIWLLQIARLVCAWVTTGKAIHLRTFSGFISEIRWIFTAGVVLAVICDLLITTCLCYFLHMSRNKSRVGTLPAREFEVGDYVGRMNDVIDEIILFTVENGALICAVSISSFLCVILMPHNLVFIAIHFVLSKLYVNSVLASLNARGRLREHKSGSLGISSDSRRTGMRLSLRPTRNPEDLYQVSPRAANGERYAPDKISPMTFREVEIEHSNALKQEL